MSFPDHRASASMIHKENDFVEVRDTDKRPSSYPEITGYTNRQEPETRLHQQQSTYSNLYIQYGGSSHTVINESTQAAYQLKHTGAQCDSTERKPKSQELQDDSSTELKTYPVAWLVLCFVVLFRTAVAIFGSTFSPIPLVIAGYLNISLSGVNWLYNIMGITYIIVSCFTSWMYERIGVKRSLFLAGVLLSVGCWIRWIAVKINPPSFAIMMLGQTIASISAPMSLNIMTVFSSLWFTENMRATASVFIASNYGSIIAMFLMPAIATGTDKIEFTVILVACICTVATIPFLFIPARPPTPASLPPVKDDCSEKENQDSLLKMILGLIKNVHFLVILIIHGINIGLSIAWSGLMNQAISPYGYTNGEIGNIAAIAVVGGSLGCFVAGPILDKTKQHIVLLKIITPLIFTTYLAFIFIIKTDSFAAILYVNFLNQFLLSFIVPICVELGVETTYPITESISTSLLWQLGQLTGFILVVIMDQLRDPDGNPKNNMYKALIFQASLAGVMVLFAMVFNGPMLRMRALQKEKDIKKLQETTTKTIEAASSDFDRQRCLNEQAPQYDNGSSETTVTVTAGRSDPEHVNIV
ncbi:MFS general substrate transporter [Rhizopus microsporus]|uniref:MFS general substrate transporter n=1 Tax=Rhizopus microsporus TaxID=58291 RepID=A0A1X0S3D5_RHIZD|nr:MFS general substrate transporter [Rhizopus microsporus]